MILTLCFISFLSFAGLVSFTLSDISYRVWLDRWSVVQKVLCVVLAFYIPIELKLGFIDSFYVVCGCIALSSVNYTIYAVAIAVVVAVLQHIIF